MEFQKRRNVFQVGFVLGLFNVPSSKRALTKTARERLIASLMSSLSLYLSLCGRNLSLLSLFASRRFPKLLGLSLDRPFRLAAWTTAGWWEVGIAPALSVVRLFETNTFVACTLDR